MKTNTVKLKFGTYQGFTDPERIESLDIPEDLMTRVKKDINKITQFRKKIKLIHFANLITYLIAIFVIVFIYLWSLINQTTKHVFAGIFVFLIVFMIVLDIHRFLNRNKFIFKSFERITKNSDDVIKLEPNYEGKGTSSGSETGEIKEITFTVDEENLKIYKKR